MKGEQSFTGDPEIDRLLFRWGEVIRGAEGWARGFALSIQRARQKHGWTPSPKQLALMRRMVSELPKAGAGAELILIERG